jgi:hypothetical protein
MPLEIWGGDETALRLVPVYPDPSLWEVAPGSRSVALRWPAVEGGRYELIRELGAARESVYAGSEPSFVDEGLPVGALARYVLKVTGPQGDVLSASSAVAETLPPVSRVSAEARLETDLRVSVSWALGGGTADRIRIVRKGPVGEEVILDTRERDRIPSGAVSDGPFLPTVDRRALEYRVEAWVGAAAAPAAQGLAYTEVPPLVERVSAVVQSVDRGAVVVQWETFPREGIAQGFAVFRERGEDGEGELLARVEDPFAREFDYPVEDPVKASGWRHFVLPYLGARYIPDPEALTIESSAAEESFESRVQKGAKIPNLAVHWDPYPGAIGYLVRAADGKEVALKRNYMEVHGIQNPLMGSSQQMGVYAVDRGGTLVELVTVESRFQHYARKAAPREEDR